MYKLEDIFLSAGFYRTVILDILVSGVLTKNGWKEKRISALYLYTRDENDKMLFFEKTFYLCGDLFHFFSAKDFIQKAHLKSKTCTENKLGNTLKLHYKSD